MDSDPYHYDRDAKDVTPLEWTTPEDAIESSSRIRVFFLTSLGYTVVRQIEEPVVTFFGGVKSTHRYYLTRDER